MDGVEPSIVIGILRDTLKVFESLKIIGKMTLRKDIQFELVGKFKRKPLFFIFSNVKDFAILRKVKETHYLNINDAHRLHESFLITFTQILKQIFF